MLKTFPGTAMLDISLYPAADKVSRTAMPDEANYRRLYRQSIDDPQRFWAEQARTRLDWSAPWTQVREVDAASGQVRWFRHARLNACHNCLDRHLAQYGERTALIWEADEPGLSLRLSYRQLHRQVCRLANVLKARGIGKGDRVGLYLPMIPEAVCAMLACGRLGAVHSLVTVGLPHAAVVERLRDTGCRLVISADQQVCGGQILPLKNTLDTILAECPGVDTVLVVERTHGPVTWVDGRDFWYHEALRMAGDECPNETMDADDPLFILYTSGSTGKPRGVVHGTGGYLLQAALSFRTVFDYRDGEVFWCTANLGWITGQTYTVYGALACAATVVLYEGQADYPSAERYWQIVDQHQVNIFYSAPALLRGLMRQGPRFLQSSARMSLRVLGSVGEPIDQETWEWYFNAVGQQRCPVIDTWWQTETGVVMLAPRVASQHLKPGCAMQPCYGVEPVLLDEQGSEVLGPGNGVLVLKPGWPGQMQAIHGDPHAFAEHYFTPFPGYYRTGDGARRDADGDLWITGRSDDAIRLQALSLGSADIERALLSHPHIAEAAVVGCPHPLKGEAVYAFVTPMSGVTADDDLRQELLHHVSQALGREARPAWIQFAQALPKTHSGKILRRVLKLIACHSPESLGDLSAIADPQVIADLVAQRLGPEDSSTAAST
jgi:acetyl-CoA synthetase